LVDIGEGAVAIVLEEAAVRLAARGEAFEAPALTRKHIQPTVVS